MKALPGGVVAGYPQYPAWLIAQPDDLSDIDIGISIPNDQKI